MINDIPFQETPLFVIDEGKTFVIVGHDGTILYRFPVVLLTNLINEANEQAVEVGDFQI